MVPLPLRKGVSIPLSGEWNPATYFIIIFILIGSMSINQIRLRIDHEKFTRQSDTRIGLLREVLDRIQRGEKVDVEKVLGTGDSSAEEEWKDGACKKASGRDPY